MIMVMMIMMIMIMMIMIMMIMIVMMMLMLMMVREGGFPDWAAPESRCNLPSSLSLLSLQTLAVAVCWS